MIVLRKVRGVKGLTALFQCPGATRIGGSPRSGFASMGLLAILALTLLLAALVAWFTGDHALAHLAFAPHTPALMAVGSLASQLKETTEKLAEKQKALHEIFEKAGETVDFSNADVLRLAGAKDSKEAVEKVRAMNAELEDLGKKRDEYAEMKKINDDNERRRQTPVNNVELPGDNGDRKTVQKSLGELIVGSRAMKEFRASKSPHMSEEVGYGLAELKATFLTTAGWAPESLRTGLVVAKATRPIQVLDIIPSGTTSMAAVKYMEETTLTHASAERAENAAYAESAFALTERSEPVRSIGASVPVTDEQLDDVEGVQSYLEQRLTFGNRQRMDGQIVIGDGNAPNLLGLKNKSGIQTQAKGADPNPDAIYKAGVNVRITGRAIPNAVIIHPTNWQSIRLLKTADGIYIWASPVESGPERLWGWQVVQSDADAAGLAYVADFANYTMLFERKGMEVAVGYVNADFLNGRRTIRAGLRVAFAIFRAAAVCQVTGLT